MKKILCVLMALLTIGCLAGCVDHDDGICDECEGKYAFRALNADEDSDELCAGCWANKAIDEAQGQD